MPRFQKGYYTLKNPSKYVGTKTPMYRSGWEFSFMKFCDEHPNIIAWSSEPIRIPYRNPFTGKYTVYVPDFLVTYLNKKGRRFSELIAVSYTHLTLPTKA